MKKYLSVFMVLLFFGLLFSPRAFAYRKGSHPSLDPNYSHDSFGHLTRNDNLYNDSDGDGRFNYNDRNDSNPWR